MPFAITFKGSKHSLQTKMYCTLLQMKINKIMHTRVELQCSKGVRYLKPWKYIRNVFQSSSVLVLFLPGLNCFSDRYLLDEVGNDKITSLLLSFELGEAAEYAKTIF